MKTLPLALPAIALILLGCTTPYTEKQRQLFWQWHRHQMSEKEYQQQLKELKNERPWGGIGGAFEDTRDPILWSADQDTILLWSEKAMEFMMPTPRPP